MTDNKSDNGNAKPDAKPAPALIAKADAKPAAPVAPAPKSGRGVAWLALLAAALPPNQR